MAPRRERGRADAGSEAWSQENFGELRANIIGDPADAGGILVWRINSMAIFIATALAGVFVLFSVLFVRRYDRT